MSAFGVKRTGQSARRCSIQGRRNMRAKDAKRRSGKAAWVAIDLFRRLDRDWRLPVGRKTLDDGGCNGNRILGDRCNYRVRDRLHRCSEPSEKRRLDANLLRLTQRPVQKSTGLICRREEKLMTTLPKRF